MTSTTLSTTRWGRALGAAAFAAGASSLWPYVADHVAAHGGVLSAVLTGLFLAGIGCGWRHHGPWLPTRLTSLYVFGLAAGALGGAVAGLT